MTVTVRHTETGIACARCSHWTNGRKVVVHHASVADVRTCCFQPRTAPAASTPKLDTSYAINPWPPVSESINPGRYAVEVDGTLKFYKIDKPTEGRWSGRTFVSVQASDELYPIRSRSARDEILTAIAADPDGAMRRYGREIGRCGHCHRTLTDETSRAMGIGPVCAGKI